MFAVWMLCGFFTGYLIRLLHVWKYGQTASNAAFYYSKHYNVSVIVSVYVCIYAYRRTLLYMSIFVILVHTQRRIQEGGWGDPLFQGGTLLIIHVNICNTSA